MCIEVWLVVAVVVVLIVRRNYVWWEKACETHATNHMKSRFKRDYSFAIVKQANGWAVSRIMNGWLGNW